MTTPGPARAALMALQLSACSGLDIATSSVPSLATASELAAFDFDGDGEHDVVASFRDSTKLGVYRVDDAASSVFPLDGVPGALAGIENGFVVAFPQTGSVAVMRREGDDFDRIVAHDGDPMPLDVVAADLDRNGRDDVVIAGAFLLIAFQNDDGSFAAPVGLPLDPHPRARPHLAFADLDRDGTIDLLCGMATGDRDDAIPDHLRAFRNATHGRLDDESWYRAPWPERVAAGDLDGDGLTDAVAFGREGAWVFFGLGHGWLGPSHAIAHGRFVDGLLVDVDDDGKHDVVALDQRRDAVVLLRSVGPRRFAPAQRIAVGDSPSHIVVLPSERGARLVTANARDLTVLRIAPR